MLTRGLAGVVDPDGVLIVNLPGSPGGVASGMPVILSVARPHPRSAGRGRSRVSAVRLAAISAEPLDLDAHLTAVDDRSDGGGDHVRGARARSRSGCRDRGRRARVLRASRCRGRRCAGSPRRRSATRAAIVAVSHRVGRLAGRRCRGRHRRRLAASRRGVRGVPGDHRGDQDRPAGLEAPGRGRRHDDLEGARWLILPPGRVYAKRVVADESVAELVEASDGPSTGSGAA